MSMRMRALQGVALASLIAGCNVNLSDVNLSNIGNGNKVDANVNADVKVGDVNVGDGNAGGDGNQQNGPGKLLAVNMDRPHYRVRRGLDPRTMTESFPKENSEMGPMPDFESLKEAMVIGLASYEGGGNEPLPMDGPDWKWILPPSLERVTPPDGHRGFLLVAKTEAATGTHVIRLEFAHDAKIAATASVEILDAGSADVVLE